MSTPANGATNQPVSGQMTWNASANATSYDVYLGNSSPPPLVGNAETQFYNYGPLANNTLYYWTVVAQNAGGSTPTSSGIWHFTTVYHDVGATAILAPVGQIDSGNVVVPRAVIENFGTTSETLDAVFTISDGYADTVGVILTPGGVDTVDFADWTALTVDWFAAKCTTLLAGDVNPANDAVKDSFQVIPPTGIAGAGKPPFVFALEQGRPTPFSGRTTIQYALPRACQVEVVVFSTAGQLVRTLHVGSLAPGRYQAVWNGRDEQGRMLSPGVYYCRMRAGGFTATRKFVVQR